MSSTTNKRSTNGQSLRIIPFTAWTMTQPLLVVMSAFVLTMTLVGQQPVESKPLVEKPPLAVAAVKVAKPMTTQLSDVAAISDTYVAPAPIKQAAPAAVVVGTSDAMQFIFQKESGGVPCKINGGEVNCNYVGSRACGLGQSLPCSKLTNVCSLADSECQIAFFTDYANNRYGGWENARIFWLNHKWW